MGVIVALAVIVAAVAAAAAECCTAVVVVATMIVAVAIAVMIVVAAIELPVETPLRSKVVTGTPVIRRNKTRLRLRGADGQPKTSGTKAPGQHRRGCQSNEDSLHVGSFDLALARYVAA